MQSLYEIYQKYEKLIYFAANRYASRYQYVDKDELISVAQEALIKILRTKKDGRRIPYSKCKTSIWFAINTQFRKDRADCVRHVEINDLYGVEDSSYQEIVTSNELSHVRRLLDNDNHYLMIEALLGRNEAVNIIALNRFNQRKKRFEDGHYTYDKNSIKVGMPDIAEYFNVSVPVIYNWIKSIKQTLKGHNFRLDSGI